MRWIQGRRWTQSQRSQAGGREGVLCGQEEKARPRWRTRTGRQEAVDTRPVLETADEGGNSGLIAGPCCSGTDKTTSALLGTLHVPCGNTGAEVKDDLRGYRGEWTCGCLTEPHALMRKYSQAIQEIQGG